LKVADAFLALLDGTLPKDPPNGAWMVGIGEGYHAVPYKDDFPEGRFVLRVARMKDPD
jgi:hypothetical protein